MQNPIRFVDLDVVVEREKEKNKGRFAGHNV